MGSSAGGKTVLIADDEASMRVLISATIASQLSAVERALEIS